MRIYFIAVRWKRARAKHWVSMKTPTVETLLEIDIFLQLCSCCETDFSMKLSLSPFIRDLFEDTNQYTLGNNWLENDLAEKVLGALGDIKLAMSQQHALAAKKANSIPV